jgi:DNA-binding GntR family transcriptional regulator
MARFRGVSPSTAESIAGLKDLNADEQRGGVSGQLSDILRRAIVNIDLPPGTALTESDVGNRFGVSRTPVREAFRTLVAEGLLLILPQKGSFVSKLKRSALQDALFIREALECAAGRLAVRAPLEQRQQLLRIVERQREAIKYDDVAGIFQADEDLHRTIMVLSGHGDTWILVQQARTHLARLRRIANMKLKASEDALEHHAHIADAIVRGAEAETVQLLRTHILQIQGFIDRIAEIYPQYIE